MTENRPPMPAGLRRRVLVEAGHRCAIPTCRYIEVDVHHIIPWETCRSHDYENLIALCPNCHRRAGREEIDRKSLRIYKANLRFTHDRFSQFEVDFLFESYKLPHDQLIPWPRYLRLLIKRLLDAGYIQQFEMGSILMVVGAGLRTDPTHVRITQEGRAFIESLGLEWMSNPIE